MTAKIGMSIQTKRRIPNALTTARILAIPLIVVCILSVHNASDGFFGRWSFLIFLFILACVTDFLDGFLARRWNVTSDFGRMIDPIADKLLVAACLIAFSIVAEGSWIILLPAMIIIGRDILVSGAREHAALKSVIMPPTKLAKWKTAFEMLAIALLIAWLVTKSWLPIDNEIPKWVSRTFFGGVTCLWFAAVLSAYTGSLYLRAALKG